MGVTKNIIKLSIKKRSAILSEVDKGVTVNVLCEKYNVHKSTISRIKAKRSALRQFVTRAESGPGKRVTLKASEYPQMEKALYGWFQKQRAKNVPLSNDIIKSKAIQLHQKIREKPCFNASNGWIAKFKKRHGIRMLKICGEKLSNKCKLVEPFLLKFRQKIKQLNLTADQIYNADESGLFYRMLPNRTLVTFNESSAPGLKVSKDRVTFLACTNASGMHKVKLFVIGKAANPRAFKNFENKPVTYKANKNAWMTFILFEEWFHNVFVPEVK